MAERQPGMLPSKTESNPREHAKVITLRLGKELPSPSMPFTNDDSDVQVDESKKEDKPEEKGKEAVEEKEDSKKIPLRPYQPPIPYPAKLKQDKIDQQFNAKQHFIRVEAFQPDLLQRQAEFQSQMMAQFERQRAMLQALIEQGDYAPASLRSRVPVQSHFDIPLADDPADPSSPTEHPSPEQPDEPPTDVVPADPPASAGDITSNPQRAATPPPQTSQCPNIPNDAPLFPPEP
ncbi:mediator of RNA polymerase II transcription subunit 15-like [Ricinus communis]|uniref:mediator of RNA polymerase II transcription subunit 15-like n=1 Tax=Ricinus communis TaxID=3988 RepID=UPI00201A5E10|nr:mediator of RNA polymerase II transcription subunit 15-like [Ricinus communis]